jgi:membrane protein
MVSEQATDLSKSQDLGNEHPAPTTDHIYPLKKDIILGHKASEATTPYDTSVSGEEDPGVGLEFLVTDNKPKK